MEGAVVAFIVFGVLALIAWLIQSSKASAARAVDQANAESLQNVEIVYDKFSDETGLTYGSRWGETGYLLITASHKGQDVPSAPEGAIVFCIGARQPGIILTDSIILLIDGRRLVLEPIRGVPASMRAQSGARSVWCSISFADLQAVSEAASVEGQAGQFEFRLSGDHRAGIAKIVQYFAPGSGPEQVKPLAQLDPVGTANTDEIR